MGRLTAWIASRRQSRRSARAHQHKSAGTAARPLGFERYEERIALSTNAAIEFAPVEQFKIDAREGGWIHYSYADKLTVLSAAPTGATSTGLVPAVAFDGLDFAIVNRSWSFLNSQTGPLVGDAGFSDDLDFGASFSFEGESPELLATDSRVVPIPPPSSGPGGNEGGQISLTPFMGPATLGLPSASDSLYASKDRPALRTESVEAATDVPSSTPADSLRGRAVVYEVAHADSRLNGSRDRPDDSLAKLEQNNAWDASHALNQASQHKTSTVADGRAPTSHGKAPADDGGNASQQIHRDNAAAMLTANTAVHSKDAAEAEVADDTSSAAAANATAAQDAAFEQWQNELTPALDGRQIAAATADIQQRRVLGAALFVLGAIPVTKAMRRHAQHDSSAHRPRERRPSPPITRE